MSEETILQACSAIQEIERGAAARRQIQVGEVLRRLVVAGDGSSLATLSARLIQLGRKRYTVAYLSRARGVADVIASLPEGSSFEGLRASARAELLPLAKPDEIERAAERAVRENLGVRELRDYVRCQLRARGAGDTVIIDDLDLDGPGDVSESAANERKESVSATKRSRGRGATPVVILRLRRALKALEAAAEALRVTPLVDEQVPDATLLVTQCRTALGEITRCDVAMDQGPGARNKALCDELLPRAAQK